jgi:hypothetical protein
MLRETYILDFVAGPDTSNGRRRVTCPFAPTVAALEPCPLGCHPSPETVASVTLLVLALAVLLLALALALVLTLAILGLAL